MKLHEIEVLLEKFYNGETNLDEEKTLRDYLNQDDIPEQFQAEKEHFNFLLDEQELALGEEFDTLILESLKESNNPDTVRLWIYRTSGVAAALLLFLLVWFGTDLMQPKEVYGTITDPALAFSETQKVMDEVSKKMNKGLLPAEIAVKKIDENVNRVGDLNKINKALENTKSLQKIDKASNLLKSVSKVYISYGDS